MQNKNFSFSDPHLQELYLRVTAVFGQIMPIVPADHTHYFGKLSESIISQQLSTKVADIIEARVRTVIGGSWYPEAVLQTDATQLRDAGLSHAKVSYIQNIALAWMDQTVDPQKIAVLSDEEVINQLVKIKGVGRWTAEMFLIFTLGRPDVFSVGDYGLRKAVSTTYNIPIKAKPAEILTLSQNWQPQRSLAARILWKSLELPQLR